MKARDYIGLNKEELDTPCLVIDINKLNININRMQEKAVKSGKNLRPHAKTHKCIEIAKRQIAAGAIGICATKVSEAYILSKNNIPGILITSPVVTDRKISILKDCISNRDDLMVVVDNKKNLEDLNYISKSLNKNLSVLIDIDPGIGRTGINLNNIVDFAKYIKSFENIKCRGIQCYAGNLQHVSEYNSRLKQTSNIMDKAGSVIKQLSDLGFKDLILSGGGTGTHDIDLGIKAITEIQPGSYTVMDVEYSDIQLTKDNANCFQHSLTLLTTVISSNRAEHVTVDAGWKGVYVDATKPHIISHNLLEYDWGGFGDEHGKITAKAHTQLPSIGDKIEMIIPHCDPTINLYDQFYIIDKGKVVDVWEIEMRGKSQ